VCLQTLNAIRGKAGKKANDSKAVTQVHHCGHCLAHGIRKTGCRRSSANCAYNT
jgi:hypothetical protein